ncbi:MAG: hypothetical protein LC775_12755 [Acidobacteria bacterium]|nr:hypothetical protein [Acidobacteriota bacterium]
MARKQATRSYLDRLLAELEAIAEGYVTHLMLVVLTHRADARRASKSCRTSRAEPISGTPRGLGTCWPREGGTAVIRYSSSLPGTHLVPLRLTS